jgi:hypothetical protein
MRATVVKAWKPVPPTSTMVPDGPLSRLMVTLASGTLCRTVVVVVAEAASVARMVLSEGMGACAGTSRTTLKPPLLSESSFS